MREYRSISLLILCFVMPFVISCGESLEETDADILDPSEGFSFQDFPLVEGGSLIPADEIPVITLEKTREDADFYYWRLKADPVPTREDLVVGVEFSTNINGEEEFDVKVKNLKVIDTDTDEWKDLKLADKTFTFRVRTQAEKILWRHFRNAGYSRYRHLGSGARDDSSERLCVVIPKFENTSLEFMLPRSLHLLENDPVSKSYSTRVFKNDFPEIPPADDEGRDVEIAGEFAEDVVWDPRYTLSVIPPEWTMAHIAGYSWWPHESSRLIELASLDIPVYQTFDGYIIREGFVFSYYFFSETPLEFN